jgi:hypothetical protein
MQTDWATAIAIPMPIRHSPTPSGVGISDILAVILFRLGGPNLNMSFQFGDLLA